MSRCFGFEVRVRLVTRWHRGDTNAGCVFSVRERIARHCWTGCGSSEPGTLSREKRIARNDIARSRIDGSVYIPRAQSEPDRGWHPPSASKNRTAAAPIASTNKFHPRRRGWERWEGSIILGIPVTRYASMTRGWTVCRDNRPLFDHRVHTSCEECFSRPTDLSSTRVSRAVDTRRVAGLWLPLSSGNGVNRGCGSEVSGIEIRSNLSLCDSYRDFIDKKLDWSYFPT